MLPMNSDYYQNDALLRDTMKTVFPDMEAVYNFHERWLWKDRIAVYFPKARVGVEFSADGHEASLSRKWVACKEHGVALYVLLASDIEQGRFEQLRRMVDSRMKRKPKALATRKPRR